MGLLAVAAGVAAAAPETNSRQTLSVGSRTLLAFRGTSLQCLVFGPLSQVKGKSGVVCFKGPPRQRRANSRWVSMTPASLDTSTGGGDEPWKTITSGTNIRRTVNVDLNTTTTFAHVRYVSQGRRATMGCRFQVIRSIDPARRAIICADLSGGAPIPNSSGFILSQRVLASVEFRADGRIKIDAQWRLPPCDCDK